MRVRLQHYPISRFSFFLSFSLSEHGVCIGNKLETATHRTLHIIYPMACVMCSKDSFTNPLTFRDTLSSALLCSALAFFLYITPKHINVQPQETKNQDTCIYVFVFTFCFYFVPPFWSLDL